MNPVYLTVPVTDLRVNTWNPNEMDQQQYRRARNSIRRFGFIDPITVRENPAATPYEIIDGENRWKAAQDEQLTEVDIANLGADVPDHVAEQLTIILNELRGTYDPRKMGTLLTSLVAAEPLPDLLEVIPFSKREFEELAELPKVDWENIKPTVHSGRAEKWVERVFRMPADAALKVDEAIRVVREGQPSAADWRCLQTIAEEFLGP